MEKKKIKIITFPEGNVVAGPEKRLLELISGAKPLNDDEKQMIADIKKIKKAGQVVEIPAM